MAALLAACAPADTSPADTSDTVDAAELRQDIERLENEIGRLEFRVFELENAVLGDSAAAIDFPDSEPSSINATTETQSPEAPRGRYDLTPVE